MFFSVLNETCPSGYCYLQKARSTGRGGGLAVVYRNQLDLTPLALPELYTFECLAFNFNRKSSLPFDSTTNLPTTQVKFMFHFRVVQSAFKFLCNLFQYSNTWRF